MCVDVFNIDFVNELFWGGCWLGLIFVFEGGSVRLCWVINKMVSEDDFICIVAVVYVNGWW